MGGGDLNQKKSWHPHTFKNQERVWKAEQMEAAEKRKLAELQAEIHAERDREDLRRVGQASGVIANDNGHKLEWMYKGAKDNVNREEYLLGRTVDKSYEQFAEEERVAEKQAHLGVTVPKNHVEHECVPFSIRAYKDADPTTVQVDMARKIAEDPLMMIKQREMESRKKLLENPVKLKELKQLLQSERGRKSKKESKKKSKKEKKSKKSKKSKKKKRSRSSSSYSSSSGSDVDDALLAMLSKQRAVAEDDVNMEDLNFDEMVNLKYNKLNQELDKMIKSSDESGGSDRDERVKRDRRREAEEDHRERGRRNRSLSRDRNAERRGGHSPRDRRRQRSPLPRDRRVERSPLDRHRDRGDRRRDRPESVDRQRRRSRSVEKSRKRSPEKRRERIRSRSPQRRRDNRDKSRSPQRRRERSPEKRNRSKSVESKSKQKQRKRSPTPEKKRKDSRKRSEEPSKKSRKPSPLKKRDSSSSSSSSSVSDNEPTQEQKRPVEMDSEDEERLRKSTMGKSYGLVTASGQSIALKNSAQSYVEKREADARQESSASKSSESWKKPSSSRPKLTEEEKEERRREMMKNAEWRDKERESYVRKYHEDGRKEEDSHREQEFDKNFIHKELHKSAQSETVESRLKSNRNNIQRSSGAMNTNFARR